MPRRNRGPRIALTIRLSYDLYREVAGRAKARNWSMSDFVSWCVAKEISGRFIAKERAHPGSASRAADLAGDWIDQREAASGE
jgi:hypothetical protein